MTDRGSSLGVPRVPETVEGASLVRPSPVSQWERGNQIPYTPTSRPPICFFPYLTNPPPQEDPAPVDDLCRLRLSVLTTLGTRLSTHGSPVPVRPSTVTSAVPSLS